MTIDPKTTPTVVLFFFCMKDAMLQSVVFVCVGLLLELD